MLQCYQKYTLSTVKGEFDLKFGFLFMKRGVFRTLSNT